MSSAPPDACTCPWRTTTVALSATAMIALAVLHFSSVFLILRRFRFCHPFFTIATAEYMFMYGSSTTLASAVFIASLLPEYKELSSLDTAITLWKLLFCSTLPISLICLAERTCAIIWASKYEKSRHWSVFIASQLVSTVLMCGLPALIPDYDKLLGILYSSFLSSGVFCLLHVSGKLARSSRAQGHLTRRFQLTENYKTLRIFAPWVLLDSLVGVVYMIASGFDVDYFFDSAACQRSPHYLLVFVFARALALGAEATITVIVFMQLQRYKPTRRRQRRVRIRDSQISDDFKEKPLKLQNVFGVDVATRADQNAYFTQLDIQWQ